VEGDEFRRSWYALAAESLAGAYIASLVGGNHGIAAAMPYHAKHIP